jgi:hypothetical protein
MSFRLNFRVAAGGMGVVYDGTILEAKRWFRFFVIESKNAKSKSAGQSVTLFKNFEIIRSITRHCWRMPT